MWIIKQTRTKTRSRTSHQKQAEELGFESRKFNAMRRKNNRTTKRCGGTSQSCRSPKGKDGRAPENIGKVRARAEKTSRRFGSPRSKVDSLTDLFKSKYSYVMLQLNEMKQFEPTSTDISETARTLASWATRTLRFLEPLEQEYEDYESLIVPILVSAMPAELRTAWDRTYVTHDMPNLIHVTTRRREKNNYLIYYNSLIN